MRLVLLAGLLLSAPVVAQEAPQTSPSPAPEKKICRALVATGSIMNSKRECHTKAEWAAIADQSRNARDKYDNDLRAQGGRTGIEKPN